MEHRKEERTANKQKQQMSTALTYGQGTSNLTPISPWEGTSDLKMEINNRQKTPSFSLSSRFAFFYFFLTPTVFLISLIHFSYADSDFIVSFGVVHSIRKKWQWAFRFCFLLFLTDSSPTGSLCDMILRVLT